MRKFDRMKFTEQSGFFHQLSQFELSELCDKFRETKGQDYTVSICTNNPILHKIASEFETKVNTVSSPEYAEYCVRLSSIFSDINDIVDEKSTTFFNSIIRMKVTDFKSLQAVIRSLFDWVATKSLDPVCINFIMQDIIPFKIIDYETMSEGVISGEALEYFHLIYGQFLQLDNSDTFFNEFRQMIGIESDIADKVFEKYKGRKPQNLSDDDLKGWKPVKSHKIGISVPFSVDNVIRGISKKYLAELGTTITKKKINDINISFDVKLLQIMKSIDNFEICFTYFEKGGTRIVLHKDSDWYLLFQIKSAPNHILGLNVNYFGKSENEVVIIRCDDNEYKFTTDIEI